MESRKCVKCGSPIVETKATGRPKDYCSTACRRAAEHEVRRINALLSKLEERLSNARLGYGIDSAKRAQSLADEIALQEARLKALLAGHDDAQ